MQTKFSKDALIDSSMKESEGIIRKCVHCGFCTATCPTYVLLGDELDSPRGRIYLMKEMLEKQVKPTPKVVKHIDRCLSCLACMTTCPSGVNYMHLVDHARAYINEHYKRPLTDRFFRAFLSWVLPNPTRFRLALHMSKLAQPLIPLFRKAKVLHPLATMLELAPRRHVRGIPIVAQASKSGRKRVVLLQGCAEPVLRPEFRAAAMRILDRLGIEVAFAKGEVCCGALVHHMGREKASLEAAKRNVDAWIRELDEEGLDAILMTASGCGTTIKDYSFMLRNDPTYREKAKRVSAIAKDITEYLAELDIPVSVRCTLKVAYHAPCSLQHGQNVKNAPKQLLERAGYTVHVPAEAHLCCGSAGTFNILQPAIANPLGIRKVANLDKLDADVIATGNVGCATQIARWANTPIVHIIELLDWAYGGPVPQALKSLEPSATRS